MIGQTELALRAYLLAMVMALVVWRFTLNDWATLTPLAFYVIYVIYLKRGAKK